MEYQDFIVDFAMRSRKNLEIIQESSKHGNGGYEVTQLINSMLGLLVFPATQKIDQFPDEFPTEELQRILSNRYSNYDKNGYDPDSFKQVVKHLRNAVAHRHIDLNIVNDEIAGMTFEDIYVSHDRSIRRRFAIQLSVEDLNLLLISISDLLINLQMQQLHGSGE